MKEREVVTEKRKEKEEKEGSGQGRRECKWRCII